MTSELTERAITGYAQAWNACAGDPEEYAKLAAKVTAELHAEYPSIIPADMPPPPRQAILKRLLK